MMRVFVLPDDQAQALKQFLILKMKPNGVVPSDLLIAAVTKFMQDIEGQHKRATTFMEQLEEEP